MDKKSLNNLNLNKSKCRPMEIPTDEEVRALDRLREIKERVRELKNDLSRMTLNASPSEQRNQAERELIELKKEWQDWEKKREEAARARMIALGHLEPDQ